jgi:UDP-glucose 4-epimerase
MTWLITGGAGYIGSHVVKVFRESGNEVLVVDSLVTGDTKRLPKDVEFKSVDIRDLDSLNKVFRSRQIHGVVHLAALKSIQDGQKNPKLYDDVNILGTRNVLTAAINTSVERIIFSSSAAVYGNSPISKVKESDQAAPVSVYGKTKFTAEELVTNAINEQSLEGTSLRYFNVAGQENSVLGDHELTNLIPIALNSIRKGVPPIIYGTDYATPDGTCIRDYVHVLDIAQAHLAAANSITELPKIMNLGTGRGYSVKEVLSVLLEKLESNLLPVEKSRREGDIAALIADPTLYETSLDTKCSRSLANIVESLL